MSNNTGFLNFYNEYTYTWRKKEVINGMCLSLCFNSTRYGYVLSYCL